MDVELPKVHRVSAEPPNPDGHLFAYLLLTHKSPAQIEALADRILELSPRARIAVHHDSAAPAVPWEGAPPAPVHLVERSPVLWGDWSMVEATLRLLRFGVEHTTAEWFVLLSGEHWPILDLGDWETTTARSGMDAIVQADPLPSRLRFGRDTGQGSELLARATQRWFVFAAPRSEHVHRAVGALTKLSRFVHPVFTLEFAHRRRSWVLGLPRRRRSVGRTTLYRGSQWIALNREAAETVLDADPSVAEWFSKSWIPDETYLQTLLHQAAGLVVDNAPTTFVLSTPERPSPGWMRLAAEDLPAAWASGAPFARKVDPIERPEVLHAIDQAVDQSRIVSPADTRRSPR
jgi:Core-2/I-Branching enzyme